MKKFMKICAVTALILLLVGLALAAAGGTISNAGSIRDVVDRVTGGRVQMDLTGLGYHNVLDHFGDHVHYDIDDASMFDKHHTIVSGDVQETFAVENIRSLDVEVGGCAFSLEESPDADFHVNAIGTNKVQCYVEENTLHVKTIAKAVVNSDQDASIVIQIPAGFGFGELDMEIGAGTMNLGSVTAREIDLEVGAGQIIADAVQADSLHVNVAAGDARVNSLQVKEFDAEVGMGNLYASGCVSGHGNLECDMGNITLELSGVSTAFDYNIECGLGKIKIGEETYSGLAKEKALHHGAGHKMDVECAMGNVEILFAE